MTAVFLCFNCDHYTLYSVLHVVCFLFGVKRFIFSVQALEILVYMCVIFSMDKINVTKVRFLCFWCFINSTCTYACTAFIRL